MKIMTSLNFFANSSNVLPKRHVAQLCHFAHSKFANRPLGSSHKIRIIYFDWILELILEEQLDTQEMMRHTPEIRKVKNLGNNYNYHKVSKQKI